MRAVACVAVVSGLVACGSAPPKPTPPGGGSAGDAAARPPLTPPGLRLPATFQVDSYAPSLVIDPAQPTFAGTIEIAGRLTEASDVIWLHAERLTIDSATAATDAGPVTLAAATDLAPGRVALRAPGPMRAGKVVVTIRYHGALDPLDTAGTFRQEVDGSWYAFTQHESIYARRTFPCVDEPSAKVPWTLTLDVPAALVAASNTPVVTERVTGATRQVRFATTPPLPSYLVAFAVGPFDVVPAGATSGGAPIRILAIAGHGAEAAYAASVTGPVVAALERWFGMPYPYAKLDSVAIPTTVSFGAMENPGLITYREDLLELPADASASRRYRYAAVATHELAHQWFGDLVTPAWWDDIWLNESFATWLPPIILPEVVPAWAYPLQPVEDRSRTLAIDGLASVRAIRQPIREEGDILNAFDGITYGKGAAVLRMFEHEVGPARFQAGVRAYLAAHAHGTATVTDFLGAIAAAAPDLDITGGMPTFLDQPGAPELTVTTTCTAGRGEVTLTQRRYLPLGAPTPAAAQRWQIPVCVLAAVGRGGQQRQCARVADEAVTLAFTACPTWVWPNADGVGYYRTALTEPQWRAVLAAKKLPAATRLAIIGDLLAAIEAGKVDLRVALDAIPAWSRGTVPERLLAARLAASVEPWLPPGTESRYRTWLLRTFGADKALGLAPKAADDVYADRARETLVGLVAIAGQEPTLRRQAVDQIARWATLPATTRGLIARIAVDADPATHDALLAAFRATTDRRAREDLADALGSVEDPARLEAALALTLDPAIDIRDSVDLMWPATGSAATRPVLEAFVRAHADELIARLPPQMAVGMIGWLTASCDAASAPAARAFADAKLMRFPGAERQVKQAIERLTLCAARRQANQPAIDAWAKRLR
ncbi:MAG: M1 family metallopeptidase [Kofleriaceae bacterium]